MADILWRPVLAGLSCVLGRTSNEATVLLLLRGYQSYTYSAGGQPRALWRVSAAFAGCTCVCMRACAGRLKHSSMTLKRYTLLSSAAPLHHGVIALTPFASSPLWGQDPDLIT